MQGRITQLFQGGAYLVFCQAERHGFTAYHQPVAHGRPYEACLGDTVTFGVSDGLAVDVRLIDTHGRDPVVDGRAVHAAVPAR